MKRTTTTRSTTTAATPYEQITSQIILALTDGIVPWRRPWSTVEQGAIRNGSTERPYRGINTFMLALSAAASGYRDPRWLTFKQAQAAGGHVRRGEHGTPIVFWRVLEREAADGGDPDRFPLLRRYTVFNAEQCDDLALAPLAEPTPRAPLATIEAAEAIATAMPNPPTVDHAGGARAYYVPALDAIHLPARDDFRAPAAYYATLFHELGHSTGHASRLGRKGAAEAAPFGSATYSREELVAEFTSAFLCGEAGIVDQQLEQSAAYVGSWLKVLRSDPRLAVIAAQQAQKAADHVLGRSATHAADADADAEEQQQAAA